MTTSDGCWAFLFDTVIERIDMDQYIETYPPHPLYLLYPCLPAGSQVSIFHGHVHVWPVGSIAETANRIVKELYVVTEEVIGINRHQPCIITRNRSS